MTDQPPPKQLPAAYALRVDFLDLYDEFVEFHDTCAFFCDAVTTMLTSRKEFDPATLEGVKDFSNHLRENGTELKAKFQRIHEQLHAGKPGVEGTE